jgi:hypothetical protein
MPALTDSDCKVSPSHTRYTSVLMLNASTQKSPRQLFEAAAVIGFTSTCASPTSLHVPQITFGAAEVRFSCSMQY